MKKLRIMWLHSHLTHWYGGTKFVYEVIKELSKTHKITLFVQKSSKDIESKFLEIPINVTSLSNSSTGDAKFWINFQREINKQIHYLKKEASNYDVVISSMFPMNIIGNSIGIPHLQYCFEPFAFFWDTSMIQNLPILKRIFLKFVRWRFGKLDIQSTRESKKILTVNSGTQKWISVIYNQDSTPTLLGVDTSFFKPIPNKELEERYKNKKVIIHSTDWTPLKRTNWLIDEFKKINQKKEDSILLITEVQTKGTERELAIKKIKSMKTENIKLCGFVSVDMIPAYYSLADLAIYTGIGQGASAASLFVLECMACETPVVRTNDTDEEVEHGKTGFLFEKNDSDSFQKYVLKLLEDEHLNNEFAVTARRFIEEKYSWKKVADIFEKSMNEILV